MRSPGRECTGPALGIELNAPSEDDVEFFVGEARHGAVNEVEVGTAVQV